MDEKALERAVKRAMENAGTLPAKESVKLVPADWHRVCDLVLSPSPAAPDHIPDAGTMVAAPAEMPDEIVREVIEIIESAVNSAIPEPWEVSARASAAILALFAPILAGKERAELALCDLMNAAGHYKATHSEIDREALSATIKSAAVHLEATAIRAGE